MLKDILYRIDLRLKTLGLTESAAAMKAGLSNSAIRNIRRAIESGDERKGISTATLIALAPALETSACWLLEGFGPEDLPPESRQLLIRMANAPRELRERILDFAEFEIDRYERSREMAM